MTVVHFSLQPGQEIDAAVSVAMGQAPQILPFTTDERARPKIKQWLNDHGVAGDLGKLGSEALCWQVLLTFMRETAAGDMQMFGSPATRFVASSAGATASSLQGPEIALARLLLVLAEPGYSVAVERLMADEDAAAAEPDIEW